VDFGAGQCRPQRDIGRHVCEVAMRSSNITRSDTEYLCAADARTNQPEQQANCGGLSRAVWAEKAKDLTGGDAEAQIVDGDDGAEPFGEAVDADCYIGGGAGMRRGIRVHRMPFTSRATDCRPDFPAHQ